MRIMRVFLYASRELIETEMDEQEFLPYFIEFLSHYNIKLFQCYGY